MKQRENSLKSNAQSGQMFVGYLIALLITTVVMVSVMKTLRQNRQSSDRRIYQTQALALARQGFEEGLSYFRRQPSGVYLDDSAEKPLDQFWLTPWPIHPDSAFLPQSGDTDHYSKISFPANVNMSTKGLYAQRAGARAIIRTFPLTSLGSTSNSAEVKIAPLWGRYVIRRQNERNWSPGPNTMAAFTDSDASHDLTHIRTQGVPGSGNYWSLVSRAYVMAAPNGVTQSSGFENTAMFEGGNLVSAPKLFYNNKRLMLSTARVYGELYRINFEDRAAAVWVPASNKLVVNTNGIVNGSSLGYGVTYVGGGSPTNNGFLGGGLGATSNAGQVPTVSRVFPGLNKVDLQKQADYVGSISIFPNSQDSNLSAIASETRFYYLTGSSTFANSTSASLPVMTGVGLVYVDGNLTFNAGSLSAWSGIIFVDGNVTIRGPVELSGTLIATGTVTVGNSADNNKANVEYNADSVQIVKDYLQKFRVDKNSILVSYQ